MEVLPPPTTSALGLGKRRSARRCLTFGSTIADGGSDSPMCAPQEARNASNAFVHELLVQMAATYRDKWEFDFTRGEPLPWSAQSRFEYTLVDAATVPPLYAPECVPPPASPSSLVDSAAAAVAAANESAASSDAENTSPTQRRDSNARAHHVAARIALGDRADEEASGSPPSSSSSIVCPSFGAWSPTRKLLKPTLVAHITPKKCARQSAIGDFMPRRTNRRSARLVSVDGSAKRPPTHDDDSLERHSPAASTAAATAAAAATSRYSPYCEPSRRHSMAL